MGLFGFFGWACILTCLVALAWPLNVPVMALAYKVRRGTEPVDYEAAEFWTRALLAALGPAVLALLVFVAAYLLVVPVGLPSGPVLLVLFLGYLPAAVGLVWWCFGLDEMLDALGVFVLYILMPVLPLLVLGWAMGLFSRLGQAAPWLVPGG